MKIRLGSDGVVIQVPDPPPGLIAASKTRVRKCANWLLSYAAYTDRLECPPSYNLWVGIATILGAAQRKIFMMTEYFPVHTNIYLLLVGPAGKTRKTTAMRQGKKMLKQVPGVHFSTNASSPEALIDQLAQIPSKEHQSLTSFNSELSTILGSNSAGMIDFLTEIWDCEPDWHKQTVTRKLQTINAPWLNFIAGSTPEWMAKNLSKTTFEGGFAARSIFIHENQRILKSPFPKPTEFHKALEKDLVHDLAQIATLHGEFTFAPDAEAFYDKWYMDPSRFPTVDDPRTMGYFDRKHVLVLKIAMALSLAEGDSLVLQERDLRTAIGMLEEIEPAMERAMSTIGTNPFATITDRIWQDIKASPKGLSHAEILGMNLHNLRKEEVQEILATLKDMQRIEWDADTKLWRTKRNGAKP